MTDPADVFHSPTLPRVDVEVGARSDKGNRRRDNQDHYLAVRRRRSRSVLASSIALGALDAANEDAYVLAVADGMGGRVFGELASRIALRTGWDLGSAERKWTLKATEDELGELEAKARLYFELIDVAIAARAADQPSSKAMGTTLTIFYSVSTSGFVFHAGDSRAYLWSDGKLLRLTRDHTVAQQLVDAGAISKELAAKSPYRSVLTNYVGGARGDLRVDVSRIDLKNDDVVVVCSDGLTDMVPEPAIAATLAGEARPQPACDELVRLALEAGGRDNVTVVLARYRIPA